MTLDKPALHRLTGKLRKADQIAWLEARGVPFRMDGERILVAEQHVLGWLAGQTLVQPRAPNLAGVR